MKKNVGVCGCICTDIPCLKFWQSKKPKWTDEEHRRIVEERVVLLKGLARSQD